MALVARGRILVLELKLDKWTRVTMKVFVRSAPLPSWNLEDVMVDFTHMNIRWKILMEMKQLLCRNKSLLRAKGEVLRRC